MSLKVQRAELMHLDNEIRNLSDEFQEMALQSSISDLVYILKRIYQLLVDVPDMDNSIYGEAASSSIILIEP